MKFEEFIQWVRGKLNTGNPLIDQLVSLAEQAESDLGREAVSLAEQAAADLAAAAESGITGAVTTPAAVQVSDAAAAAVAPTVEVPAAPDAQLPPS